MKKLMIIFCLMLGVANQAMSDATTDLAKASQNPVSDLISVPFNNNFNFDFGPQKKTQYILDIKPVIPFHITPEWNLITRAIIPVINQPDFLPERGRVAGLGDINPSLFLSPAHPGKIIYGIGPTMVFPAATDRQLGQGKYSLGPTAVVLTMPGHWVIGFLTSNIWSVAGQSERPNVNFFSLQYFINYNFSHGWFLTSAPIITANWEAPSKNRWTVPFGLGAGRVFKIGKQNINASVQGYDNVVTPRLGSDWQLQLNVSLLFPE